MIKTTDMIFYGYLCINLLLYQYANLIKCID